MKFHNMDFNFFIPQELNFLFNNCNVLDLASHTGESSICCKEQGASSVLGIDPRIELVEKSIFLAKQHNIKNVEYIVGNATDIKTLENLLHNIDTVVTFGMFYHIADHNLLIKTICESNAKHIIIETEYGIESPLPSMLWYIEKTNSILSGYNNGYDQILAGVPNLQWINDCLTIYGWKIIYYKAFYQEYLQKPRQRMILAAVNLKNYDNNKIKSLPLDLWEWHVEPNQIEAKTFIGYTYEI
jgi:hypothetical protein